MYYATLATSCSCGPAGQSRWHLRWLRCAMMLTRCSSSWREYLLTYPPLRGHTSFAEIYLLPPPTCCSTSLGKLKKNGTQARRRAFGDEELSATYSSRSQWEFRYDRYRGAQPLRAACFVFLWGGAGPSEAASEGPQTERSIRLGPYTRLPVYCVEK